MEIRFKNSRVRHSPQPKSGNDSGFNHSLIHLSIFMQYSLKENSPTNQKKKKKVDTSAKSIFI
ncbi:hypothetical protein BLOT_008861 [Blomia tropicalis]|nr:hypothetical protein BLOT_008861 [Blomia tropicalis]